MRSWFSTFRKAELSPIALLAHRIVETSVKDAESLKVSISTADERDRRAKHWLILREFLYFFMHLSNRFAFTELGQEKRCKVQDELYPLLIRPTIEGLFGHWPPDTKDAMEEQFVRKLNESEIEYTKCKKIMDPDNPLSEDALIAKFAGRVCGGLEFEQNDSALYVDTYMKAVGLALDSLDWLNLPETLRVINKEL